MLPSTNNNNRRDRENETEEQRLSRLAKQRTWTDNNRANETSLETQQHRQRDREHHAQSALQADMAIIDNGQQDLDVLPPNHRVLLQQDLVRAARGEIPLQPLRMHKSVDQMVTAFLKKQFSQVLRTCMSCSERWWPESLKVNNDKYRCKTCSKDARTHNGRIFTLDASNDMDQL